MFRALVVTCALLVCSASGCELLDADRLMRDAQSGSLRVPLGARGEDGAHYRITHATFEISGAAMLTLTLDPQRDAALSTPLPAGAYSLFVRPGYRLMRVDGQGAEEPVEAELVAKNPVHFHVAQAEAVTLKLAFRLGEETLTFGAPPVRLTLLAP